MRNCCMAASTLVIDGWPKDIVTSPGPPIRPSQDGSDGGVCTEVDGTVWAWSGADWVMTGLNAHQLRFHARSLPAMDEAVRRARQSQPHTRESFDAIIAAADTDDLALLEGAAELAMSALGRVEGSVTRSQLANAAGLLRSAGGIVRDTSVTRSRGPTGPTVGGAHCPGE